MVHLRRHYHHRIHSLNEAEPAKLAVKAQDHEKQPEAAQEAEQEAEQEAAPTRTNLNWTQNRLLVVLPLLFFVLLPHYSLSAWRNTTLKLNSVDNYCKFGITILCTTTLQ